MASFKKAVIRKHGIGQKMVSTIRAFYEAVVRFFKTIIALSNSSRRQLVLNKAVFYIQSFQHLPKANNVDALGGFNSSMSISGITISNLRFAAGADLLEADRLVAWIPLLGAMECKLTVTKARL